MRLVRFRCRQFSTAASFLTRPNISLTNDSIIVGSHVFPRDEVTNVTERILSLVQHNYVEQRHHPIGLLTRRIQNYFDAFHINNHSRPIFAMVSGLSPIVTMAQNFDSLLVPVNHPSRKLGDSYYLNKDYLLRAHTSAHQVELLKSGLDAFLVAGDVYRRDEVDRSHHPAFHQLEGVRTYSAQDLGVNALLSSDGEPTDEVVDILERDLKDTLEGLCAHLFGKRPARWVDTTFPFTRPSWELEVEYEGDWMEMLGCGVIAQPLLVNSGANTRAGWAFGLGLDRLAMALYSIPDIRILWSNDDGVTKQFANLLPESEYNYCEVSKHPSCYCDVSAWLPNVGYSEQDFNDLVRSIAGDLVERIELIDFFSRADRRSHCYRITYRHLHRVLTQGEVNKVNEEVRKAAADQLHMELR